MIQRICLTLLLLSLSVMSAPLTVVYPRHQGKSDPQLDYVLGALALALKKSGQHYQLRQSELPMVQSRVVAELAAKNGMIDVMWAMTNDDREIHLLPIRIPIDMGLIGWRVALVRADRIDQFAKVQIASELAGFVAGQMHDWPDTAILRANAMKVETSSDYEGLFKQLGVGRIDYFPRSVIEIRHELESHPNLSLAIEPGLLIRYPAAFYFFVSRNRPELGRDIDIGLSRAMADGSLDKLFNQHFGKLINDLQLDKRRVIELSNPFLPRATPLQNRRLWYGYRPLGQQQTSQ